MSLSKQQWHGARLLLEKETKSIKCELEGQGSSLIQGTVEETAQQLGISVVSTQNEMHQAAKLYIEMEWFEQPVCDSLRLLKKYECSEVFEDSDDNDLEEVEVTTEEDFVEAGAYLLQISFNMQMDH